MRKSIPVIVCTAVATAFALSAAAHGPGGGGGDGFSHGSPTGPSQTQALQNSNGRFAADRDKGLERAEDRMSQQGADHEKATDAQKKRSLRRDGK